MPIFSQESKYFEEKKHKKPIFSNKIRFHHELKLLVMFYLSSNIVDWWL